MIISMINDIENHPSWSIEYTRTQGMNDDTWWVYSEPDASWGSGELIGVGDSFDEAIESAERNTSVQDRLIITG